MSLFDVFQTIKRRAKAPTLPYSTCCHTFRATGITTHLQMPAEDGALESAINWYRANTIASAIPPISMPTLSQSPLLRPDSSAIALGRVGLLHPARNCSAPFSRSKYGAVVPFCHALPVGVNRTLVSPASPWPPGLFAMPGVFGLQKAGLNGTRKWVNPHCASRFVDTHVSTSSKRLIFLQF
jgi:hypothetical protein